MGKAKSPKPKVKTGKKHLKMHYLSVLNFVVLYKAEVAKSSFSAKLRNVVSEYGFCVNRYGTNYVNFVAISEFRIRPYNPLTLLDKNRGTCLMSSLIKKGLKRIFHRSSIFVSWMSHEFPDLEQGGIAIIGHILAYKTSQACW